MNILHISSNYPPRIGGPAASVPYLAREQAKQRNDVFILTHGLPRVTKGAVTVYRCGEIGGDITNIRKGLEKGIKMGVLGREIIKKHDIDVIHAHDPNVSAIAGIIINSRKKIPSFIKYSGDLAGELLGLKRGISEEDFWDSFSAKTVVGIEKFLLSRFHRVVVQNEYQKKMLKYICKVEDDKIVQIPNGIHVYEYSADEIEKAKNELPIGLKIASVCRLVPWKGLEYGIKAMKNIDGKYIIFGDGPDKQRLEGIAKKEDVSDRVIFFGKIPHGKVQLYLKNCDVLLIPSVYEPFGISILDGFAAGVPVVGSKVGGIPELLDKERLFEVRNADEILDKIDYSLRNRGKIVARQAKKLEKYLWPKIANDLQREYECLVQERI